MYPTAAGPADYLGVPESIDEVIRSIEMPPEWVPLLSARADEQGVDFLATPFDEQAVDVLKPFVPAYKVASYELTHEPLLRIVAAKRKPVTSRREPRSRRHGAPSTSSGRQSCRR